MALLAARSLIRYYIKEMLIAKVDVGGRVYVNTIDTPLNPEELPCVNLIFDAEPAVVVSGSANLAKRHTKKLEVMVQLVVENRITGAETPYGVDRSLDHVEYLAQQVEDAFNDDLTLARRLDSFDENYNYSGLVDGSRLLGSMQGSIKTEADTACLAQALTYEIPYNTRGWSDRRLLDFEIGTTSFVYGSYEPIPPVEPIGDHMYTDVTFSDVGASALGTIPEDRFVMSVIVDVETAFDGAATLFVGDAADPDRLMTAIQCDLGTVGRYAVSPHYLYETETVIILTIVGSPTVGAAKAILYYQ